MIYDNCCANASASESDFLIETKTDLKSAAVTLTLVSSLCAALKPPSVDRKSSIFRLLYVTSSKKMARLSGCDWLRRAEPSV